MIHIIYLAFGYRYVVMAANSALSVRRFGTKSHITIITDVPLKRVSFGETPIFDDIIVREDAFSSGYSKFQIFEYAKDGLNLFLDCDTEVWKPIDIIQDVASRFDISVRCLVRAPKRSFALSGELDASEAGVCELNTGVFFFNKTEGSREIFTRWAAYYKEMGLRPDQPAFLRSVIDARTARLLPLAENWNARPQLKGDLSFIKRSPEKVRILHYRHPMFWPDVAIRLSEFYSDSNWEFTSRSSGLDDEILKAERILRVYGSQLFKNRIGRKFLNRFVLPNKRFRVS